MSLNVFQLQKKLNLEAQKCMCFTLLLKPKNVLTLNIRQHDKLYLKQQN